MEIVPGPNVQIFNDRLQLPENVLDSYHEMGISEIFQWQGECLSISGVLDAGRNLVYAAPTSAGKTLIAEIIILKRFLELGRKAMFILPYVSVSKEKMLYMQKLFGGLGIRVGGFMGGQSPPGGLASVDVALCTIEKGNSLINRMLEEGDIYELGVVVVDELHMIGDSHRGYLLELLLTKLLYCSQKNMQHTQIIGMSATLPNLQVVANWLDAALYTTSFRPIPLLEMVKCGSDILDHQLEVIRSFRPPVRLPSVDDDDVFSLCLETLLDGHSVLVFCPTKSWCEKLSDTIAAEIYRLVKNCQNTSESRILREALQEDSLTDIMEQLKRGPAGVDPQLSRMLPYGVAFHHAGLTIEEREIIESGFRRSVLRVLVATSTLSSGVNLPARRVIMRTPVFHNEIIDALTYKQMAGRAGRKGVDSRGESVLIVKPRDLQRVRSLLTGGLPPVKSCLIRGNNLSGSLKRAVLEVVVNRVVDSVSDVYSYIRSTLLSAISNSESLEPPLLTTSRNSSSLSDAVIQSCLNYLVESELITREASTAVTGEDEPAASDVILRATQLGQAVLSSSLGPDDGLAVFVELDKARRNVALDTDLHLVYIVTPIYLDVGASLDWYLYLTTFTHLPPAERRVAELIGIDERFLTRCFRGGRFQSSVDKQNLTIHRRFFTAMLLSELINEKSLGSVATKFGVNKGSLQALQQQAATYAGIVTIFCNRLGWRHMELLLNGFQSRLIFGVHEELLDLVRLSLVNSQRARALFQAGFTSVSALANARPQDVERVLKKITPFESKKQPGPEDTNPAQQTTVRGILSADGFSLTEEEASHQILAESRNLLKEDLAALGCQWTVPASTSQASTQNLRSVKRGSSPAHDTAVSEVCSTPPPPPITSPQPLEPVVVLEKLELQPEDFVTTVPSSACVVESGSDIPDQKPPLSSLLGSQNLLKTEEERKVSRTQSSPSFDQLSASTTPSTVAKTEADAIDNVDLDYMDSLLETGLHASFTGKRSPLSNHYENDDYLGQPDRKKSREDFTCVDIYNMKSICDDLNRWPLDEDRKVDVKYLTGVKTVLNSPTPSLIANDVDNFWRVVDVSGQLQYTEVDDSLDDISREKVPILRKKMPTLTPQAQKFEDHKTSTPAVVAKKPCSPDPKLTLNDTLTYSMLEEAVHGLDHIKSTQDELVGSGARKSICSSTSDLFGQSGPGGHETSWTHQPPESQEDMFTTDSNHSCSQSQQDMFVEPLEPSSSTSSSKQSLPTRRSKRIAQFIPSKGGTRDKDNDYTVLDVCEQLEFWQVFLDDFTSYVGEETAAVDNLPISLVLTWDSLERVLSHPDDLLWLDGCAESQFVSRLTGVAISHPRSDIFYISLLPSDMKEGTPCLADRLAGLNALFSSPQPGLWNNWYLALWKSKETCRALASIAGLNLPLNISSRSGEDVCGWMLEDPSVAGWMLDPDEGAPSLDFLIKKYSPQMWSTVRDKFPSLLVAATSHSHLPCNLSQAEAAQLCFLVKKLVLPLRKHLQQEKVWSAYINYEMPTQLVMARVEATGIEYSPKELNKQHSRLLGTVEQLEQSAYKLAGRKFNISSSKEVAKILFTELHLPASPVNLSTEPNSHKSSNHPSVNNRPNRRALSTSSRVLAQLTRLHPLPGLIIEWRRLTAILNTTVGPLITWGRRNTSKGQSRFHSVYCHFSCTGRISLTAPNVQSVPKTLTINNTTIGSNDSLPIQFRSAFIAPAGKRLLSADYCQMELRLLAHFSKDPALLDILKKDEDPFKVMASLWFKLDPNQEVTPANRQKTKQLCYALLYGISVKKLAEDMGIEEKEAANFVQSFLNTFSGIRAFLVQIKKTCIRRARIETVAGRLRRIKETESKNPYVQGHIERQAVNTTVQGSAADICKKAMLNIETALMWNVPSKIETRHRRSSCTPVQPANLVLHLHDELIYEVDVHAVESTARIVKRYMENAINLSVPLPVKIKVGKSWNDMEELTLNCSQN